MGSKRKSLNRLYLKPSKSKPAKPPSKTRNNPKVPFRSPNTPIRGLTVITSMFHYDHPSGSDLAYSSSEAGVQGEIWIPRYRFLNSSVPPSDIEVTITIREKR